MQIDRYNHLLFPRDSNPTLTDKDPLAGSTASALDGPQSKATAVRDGEAATGGSVVLKIRVPDGLVSTAGADAPVYTNARKTAVAGDQDTDSDSMVRDHQQALDRNVGVFTRITVNKDGVLVAKAQPATPAKEPDFVALAVSAMREFSDEHERQKTSAVGVDGHPPRTPWTPLKGLQQIASRLNVFA